MIALLLICALFGCNEEAQNESVASSESEKSDASEHQEEIKTIENGHIYGKITDKIEPDILVLESGTVRFKNDYGEKVYIVTDKYDDWNEDDEIEVLFTRFTPGNESNPTRIYADRIMVLELCAKPIVYFYPEEETVCSVELVLNGELTCTYPEYKENGWSNFVAYPDGTLVFPDGKSYYALYWEGIHNVEWDFSKGFCVSGEKTAEFLEWALDSLGLTRREANEFIIYWLPLMENNRYNVISFQTSAYTDSAVLNVTPTPDTLLRVFMTYYESDVAVDIEPQTLTPTERNGFTIVEWGGSKVER